MKRKIYFHIDVNSAYLSWEAARRKRENPKCTDLRDIASAIAGDPSRRSGIILAKSIKAKKMGVRTGEPICAAMRKCPGIKLYPADFDLYIEQSSKLMEFLKQFSPDIYQYSIDEAFIDMTGTEKLFGNPTQCADMIRKRCGEELGFTINIGISENMVLAKMAGDFSKPDKTHTLFRDEIEKKMWPLPVEDLFFVGSKTAEKLRRLGMKTIGDIASKDVEFMRRHFKKHGEIIYRHANGMEGYDFLNTKSRHKSMGNSTTTPHDITDRDEARHIILALCETVCARLRKADMKAGVVSLELVDMNFNRKTMQKSLAKQTNSVNDIYGCACGILDSLWDRTPLRHLGVTGSKVDDSHTVQLNFFDEIESKDDRLYKAIDSIRKKHGDDSIKRASFVHSRYDHMEGGTSKKKKNGLVYL